MRLMSILVVACAWGTSDASVAIAQQRITVRGTITGLAATACHPNGYQEAYVEWVAELTETATRRHREIAGFTERSSGASYSFAVPIPSGWIASRIHVYPRSACHEFKPSGVVGDIDADQDVTLEVEGISARQKLLARTFFVRDELGRPVEGALIEATPRLCTNSPQLRTDAAGKVTATVCCGYRGSVRVVKPCFTASAGELGPVTEPGQTVLSAVRIQPLRIAGTVRRISDDEPLAGISLLGLADSVISGPDGTFSGEMECGGSVRITPRKLESFGAWTFSPKGRAIQKVGSDRANQDFIAIPPGTRVEIVSPNGGSYRSGDRVTIQWRVKGSDPAETRSSLFLIEDHPGEKLRRVVYDIKNGQDLSVDARGQGRFEWTVPPAGNTGSVHGKGGTGTVTSHRILATVSRKGTGVGYGDADVSDDFMTIQWGEGRKEDEFQAWPDAPVPPSSEANSFVLVSSEAPWNSERLDFQLDLQRSESVEVNIFDITGRPVRTLRSRTSLAAGRHSLTWDCRNEQGQQVAPGVYLANARSATWKETIKLIRLRN